MADANDGPRRPSPDSSRPSRCRRCGRASGPPAGFCCAGCAVATLVPRDAEGNFPANAALGSALGIAILGFNQLLLASLVWAMPGTVKRWVMASLVLGTVTALALFSAQWRSGVDRRWEVGVGALLAFGWVMAFRQSDLVLGLGLTALYFAWAVRGLLRRARESGDPV